MRIIFNRNFFLCLITAISAIISSGCGYTIHGTADLPFRTITVGKIVNKTFEPGLDDRFRLAIADELIRNGFSLEGNAAHRIEGTINTFELRTLSEKSGITSEYEIVIKGDFILSDHSGRPRALKGSGLYIVSFQSTERLGGVMALKEKATERALKDLATELIASIIYQ